MSDSCYPSDDLETSCFSDIYQTYKHLPEPFKSFNEEEGKFIYDEIMKAPHLPSGVSKKDKDPKFFRSILIYHLSENTKELVAWIEDHKSFLFRSGHMTTKDQILILEILFYHGFCKNTIHYSSLFQLYSLMGIFLKFNEKQIQLKLDWKPVYNMLYAITLNKKINRNMMTYQEDSGNIYNRLEILCFKLKKYFSKDASKQICDLLLDVFNPDLYEEDNDHGPKELGGYSVRLTKMIAFVFLIPIHPENTSEEEIKTWLPKVMEFWKDSPFSNYLRHMLINLLAQIYIHFKGIDLSEYYDMISFHFYNTFCGCFTINNKKPFEKILLPISLGRVIIWGYKPIKYLQKNPSLTNFNFEILFERFLDDLHPESGVENENFMRLIKFVSSTLCDRVKCEKQQKAEEKEVDASLFLEKEDILYFINVLKPYLDLATQGHTSLSFLARTIKNLVLLDCDSILSMYIFQNFCELSDLVNIKFLSLLGDVVVGAILNPETNSKYKYKFIQNSIEYLLEQIKLNDSNILRFVIFIFNIIWAAFPVLPKEWGKDLIESSHKGVTYSKYMKSIKSKNPQEYQFYRLYEKIHEYAVEYFHMLTKAMNADLSISNEIIKGFKYLLNAMPPEIFQPLGIGLVENSDICNSKSILGRVVNNIACRNSDTANEMLNLCIDHHMLEKDEETGEDTLVSYKFDTNDYYIHIISSAAYRYKEGAKAYIKKLTTLFKLITEHFEEDKHKNDFENLLRALISPFTRLNVKFPWIVAADLWEEKEFQLNLWNKIGDLYCKKIPINLEYITEEDIQIAINVIKDYIFPWVKGLAEKCKDKNQIKTVSIILCDLYSHICTLFPLKRPNSKEDLKNDTDMECDPTPDGSDFDPGSKKDFTSYYYRKMGISESTVDQLREIEREIFNINEILHSKVIIDDVKKRNEEIICNIGSVYKQIIQCNVLSVKSFTFNENSTLYSSLDNKKFKRQPTSYFEAMSTITSKLISSVRGEFLPENDLFMKSLNRCYEYEHYLCQIPSFQMQGKLGYTPKLVRFFPENSKFHFEKMDEILEDIIKCVKSLLGQDEIEKKDQDHLCGLMMLYDSYLNIKFEFNSERTKIMIDLFFLSKGIKMQTLRALLWSFCYRGISTPIKNEEFEHELEIENPLACFSQSSLELLEQAKIDVGEEVEIRNLCVQQREKAKEEIVQSLVSLIQKHHVDQHQDDAIFDLFERWSKFFKNSLHELIELNNYIFFRVSSVLPSVRLKAFNLIYKSYQMKIEYVEKKNSTNEEEGPEEFNHKAPFSLLDFEVQKTDKVHAFIMDQKEIFARNIIEMIMTDCGVKQDRKLISEEEGRKAVKTTIRKGKKKRTIIKLPSDKISRLFKVFYNIFNYYGVELFKDSFYPIIQEYIEKGFEDKEHQSVWKVIIFDILGAFMKTFEKYYNQDPELYNQIPFMMYELYDPKMSKELKNLYPSTLQECYFLAKIEKLDSFLKMLIEDIPHDSSLKTDKSIQMFNTISVIFSWRSVPYMRLLLERILSYDQSKLKVPANFQEEIPDRLRLIMHKNFDEICLLMSRYIYLCYKSTDGQSEENQQTIGKILEFLKDANIEMGQCSQQVLENTSSNIALFYANYFKSRINNDKLIDFCRAFQDLLIICEERAVKEEISDKYSNVLGILLKSNENIEMRRQMQQDMIKYFKHEAWRVRLRCTLVYHICNQHIIEDINITQSTIGLAIEMLEDENLKVCIVALGILVSSFKRNTDKIPSLTEEHKSKAMTILSQLKSIKGKTEESKKLSRKLKVHALIILGILEYHEFTLELWVTELALLLHKLIPFVPQIKYDILNYFTNFKKTHQQLVVFQESKYTNCSSETSSDSCGESPNELLENLKEIFSINSNHFIAY
ncbi:unnamed protein product [Moneuplotes crassus]|uniref:Uncharacterized protein n=2 Tax=Euplotes crassus TaxID=5936 RepID=A0AAD2D7A7_EUPCR|nr:unnamed protein product [Moneuplotes crassus]